MICDEHRIYFVCIRADGRPHEIQTGQGRNMAPQNVYPTGCSYISVIFAPSSMSNMVKYTYIFIMYNLVNTVCCTAMYVPYTSMNYLMTQNNYDRGFLYVCEM